jgi:hypothetical protein
MSWRVLSPSATSYISPVISLIMIASKPNAQEVGNWLSSKSRESFEPT